MGLFEGRRVLVTGGGSGIGAATCRLFAAEGAAVAVLDRDAAGAVEVADQIGGEPIVADVADPAAVRKGVDEAARALGGLTDVVSNAGVGYWKPLHTYSDEHWRAIIDVNLSGPFYVLRAAVPHLLEAGGGSIVHVASLNAQRSVPGEGPYSAAKAGVVSLTRTAAIEYAPSIRVNCVSPGVIDTPLTAPITSSAALTAGDHRRDPGPAHRRRRRGGVGDRLPGLRRGVVHHGAGHRRRRRLWLARRHDGSTHPRIRWLAA